MFVELEAGIALVSVVEFDAEAGRLEVVGDGFGVLEDVLLRILLPDGDDDDLRGRDGWRENEALVVGVGHDQRSECTPGEPDVV